MNADVAMKIVVQAGRDEKLYNLSILLDDRVSYTQKDIEACKHTPPDTYIHTHIHYNSY